MPDLFAVDVGGTFTDVVVFDGERLTGRKIPTTPDQAEGVAEVSEGRPQDLFLHGTTSATNTLLQATGARVGLVTTRGYEDIIEIARQDRPSLYDPGADRPGALVPRELRFTSDLGVEKLAEVAPGSEVLAVGLIESHIDPEEERRLVAELRQALAIPVVAASEVSPEYREYERLATTALSAYLTPSVSDYLSRLDRVLPMRTRNVMTSSGGLIPFATGADFAGRLLLSGPAGGVVAAAALARHHGLDHVLSFDMGGTSTDVCRITGGVVAVGSEHSVAGRVNRVPSVPIKTIGAGGGSIGWVDGGGALRVGPRSAGAVPGPASYGAGGTIATVTDANLVAGHIPGSAVLGGSVALKRDLAIRALATLGRQIGLGPEETAQGMLDVTDSHMSQALRSVSVEEGSDPRTATLVAFGGAGGLHASRLARQLGMRSVIVPPLSGVFSALGLAMAVPRCDSAQTVMLGEGDARYYQGARDLVARVSRQFQETFGVAPDRVERSADVRYRGQSHELEVEAYSDWAELRERFEREHLRRFGFRRPGEPIELVNLRAAGVGPAPLTWADIPAAPSGLEPLTVAGAWSRETLPVGFSLEGPALVSEANSVTLVDVEDRLTVLDDGSLQITWD